jgi:hypothetical protein
VPRPTVQRYFDVLVDTLVGSWRPADGRPLRELHAQGAVRKAVAVYGGERAQKDGPVLVLPVTGFLERLPEIVRAER